MQVVNAAEDNVVWTESYDYKLGELLAGEQQMAVKVAAAGKGRGREERGGGSEEGTASTVNGERSTGTAGRQLKEAAPGRSRGPVRCVVENHGTPSRFEKPGSCPAPSQCEGVDPHLDGVQCLPIPPRRHTRAGVLGHRPQVCARTKVGTGRIGPRTRKTRASVALTR